jgi:hypothetical protein
MQLRKVAQLTLARGTSDAIDRWMENYPSEFVEVQKVHPLPSLASTATEPPWWNLMLGRPHPLPPPTATGRPALLPRVQRSL